MRRLGTLFILLLLSSSLSAADRPTIAIIIDDLGYSLKSGMDAINLPGQLTLAMLPKRPYTIKLARRAHARGKEIMLHLPMEALGGNSLGAGGLRRGMDRSRFALSVRESFESVPHAVGVNNHMGSALTGDGRAMKWLMEPSSTNRCQIPWAWSSLPSLSST